MKTLTVILNKDSDCNMKLFSWKLPNLQFDLEFNLGKLLKTYTFILMVRKVPKPHTFLLPESAKTVIAIILE